jgi:hypothetical protein
LLVALVPAAEEAAAVADGAICDAEVPGVVVAPEEAREEEEGGNGEKSEAFHGSLDASASAIFTGGHLEKRRIALDNKSMAIGVSP